MSDLKQRLGRPGLGAIGLIVGLVVTLIFYMGFFTEWTRDKGMELTVNFRAATQLQAGDKVKVQGQDAGIVKSIKCTTRCREAEVKVEVLTDKSGPIYSDATAELRWRILLGGAYYVQIDKGTPGRGELGAGDTIPIDRTRVQVELDDLSNLFQGGPQQGLQTMLPQLARAVRDEDAPARVLRTLAGGAPTIDAGLHAVRGQELDTDLRRVVSGAAATVRNLEAPNGELTTLVSGAGATVETIAARGAELRDALGVAPQTMSELELTLGRLRPTLRNANDLVDRLFEPADDVAPTLSALRPTLVDTDQLLDRARPLVFSLRPAVRALAGTAAPGVAVIDDLRPSLARLSDTILPYMAKKDPETGKSTTVMIGGTAAGFGGLAGQKDASGHVVRFPASILSENAYLPCDTVFTDPADTALLACDSFEEALSNYFEYVPGAPGQGTARKGNGG